ncbi:hypothetical protein J4407_01855 [Candidatus Pacearchaeota archaeon]|nr:hypothetical protein [Candidatus Pacearchaeota archaeon]
MLNKKAQIGDTITWVVATVIIVVVITISILATNFVLTDRNIVFLADRQKDFVATKSVTSFFYNNKNVELMNSGNELFYVRVNKTIYPIPAKDYYEHGIGGWNFEVYAGEEKINDILNSVVLKKTSDVAVDRFSRANPSFETIFYNGNSKLRFWAECSSGGTCR